MNHIIEILDDDDDDDDNDDDEDEDEEILVDDNLVHIHIGNVNPEAMGVPLYNGGFDKPFFSFRKHFCKVLNTCIQAYSMCLCPSR